MSCEVFRIEPIDGCLVDSLRDEVAKPLQQFQDIELICRSQAGDADAFAELVARYRLKIFVVVHRIVGCVATL
jgi:hypothetical protein